MSVPVSKSKAKGKTGLRKTGPAVPSNHVIRLAGSGRTKPKKKSVSFAPHMEPNLYSKNFDISKVTDRMSELSHMAKTIIDDNDECFIGSWKDFTCLHLKVSKAEYPIITSIIGHMKKSGYVPTPKPDSDEAEEETGDVSDDAMDDEASSTNVAPNNTPQATRKNASDPMDMTVLGNNMPQEEPLDLTSDPEKSPIFKRKKTSPLRPSTPGSVPVATPSEPGNQPTPKRTKILAADSAPSSPKPMKFPFGAVAKDLKLRERFEKDLRSFSKIQGIYFAFVNNP